MTSIKSNKREEFLFDALQAELGSLEASYLRGANVAMPHSADLLYLERKISEALFKRTDGAKIMVATPTLAQGLNLPAEVVILAGDKRYDNHSNKRASMHMHEILNAAARAGRAGHLANGLVILVPEDINYESQVLDELSVLIPENDKCMVLRDPIDMVLDNIQNAQFDEISEYMINKFQSIILDGKDKNISSPFDLSKSFAAFCAKKHAITEDFDRKISRFMEQISQTDLTDKDPWTIIIASQSGFSVLILEDLTMQLIADKDSLPTSIEGWVHWLFSWMQSKDEIFNSIFKDKTYIIKIVGKKIPIKDDLSLIEKAIIAWIKGCSIVDIETIIIGDSNRIKKCDKSRCLINKFIPFSVTFVVNIMAKIVQKLITDKKIEYSYPSILEALALSIRKGFDFTAKTALAEMESTKLLSRVQVHNYFLTLPFKDIFLMEPENANFNEIKMLVLSTHR